jgi:hypothetical protein
MLDWLREVPSALWLLVVGGLLGQWFLLRQERRNAKRAHADWIRDRKLGAYNAYLDIVEEMATGLLNHEDPSTLCISMPKVVHAENRILLMAPESVSDVIYSLTKDVTKALYDNLDDPVENRASSLSLLAGVSGSAIQVFRGDLDIPFRPEPAPAWPSRLARRLTGRGVLDSPDSGSGDQADTDGGDGLADGEGAVEHGGTEGTGETDTSR